MKKITLIVLFFGILLLAGGIFAYFKNIKAPAKKSKETGEPVVTQIERINDVEIEKRPYVTLIPREDGKELFLTIDGLKLGETSVEYELEYQAGTMIQGVFGRINFEEEKPPITKKLLLGSCSRGKCKYDENVSGGMLTLRFSGQKDYVLKEDFTLGLMFEKEGLFALRNTKISLAVGLRGLAPNTYVVVMPTFGLPKAIEGRLVAGPIGFFTAQPVILKTEATLTFKGVEETDKLKTYGLIKDSWQELEKTEAKDGTVSVLVNQLTAFVLAGE